METALPPHLGGHANKTHVDAGALSSLRKWGVRTLLDLGCGPGGQVSLSNSLGILAEGIDGDPSCLPTHLHDFTTGPYRGKPGTIFRFDAIWCVEFLEHVEERYLPNVMETIVGADPVIVVVSAAPPGKSGHHHVNCQTESYWRRRFNDAGLAFSGSRTEEIRRASTMEREFIRERGMVFIRRR